DPFVPVSFVLRGEDFFGATGQKHVFKVNSCCVSAFDLRLEIWRKQDDGVNVISLLLARDEAAVDQ
ncbi:MAG TPA: hypothetical protein VGL71_15000, partial [Urbifossiella sp.]